MYVIFQRRSNSVEDSPHCLILLQTCLTYLYCKTAILCILDLMKYRVLFRAAEVVVCIELNFLFINSGTIEGSAE